MKPYTLEDWRLIASGDKPITKRVKRHVSSWNT